jgi:hypothetical protein
MIIVIYYKIQLIVTQIHMKFIIRFLSKIIATGKGTRGNYCISDMSKFIFREQRALHWRSLFLLTP